MSDAEPMHPRRSRSRSETEQALSRVAGRGRGRTRSGRGRAGSVDVPVHDAILHQFGSCKVQQPRLQDLLRIAALPLDPRRRGCCFLHSLPGCPDFRTHSRFRLRT